MQISLTPEFRKVLRDGDFRESVRQEQKNRMSELREKSLKVFGTIPVGKNKRRVAFDQIVPYAAARKTLGERANRSTTSRNQPKGTPLEDIRHKDGK